MVRRRAGRLSIGLVLISTLAMTAGSGVTFAQEATPTGEEAMPPEAGTAEVLAVASGVEAFAPADLIMVRLTLQPGMDSPFTPDDPMGGMLVVESGSLTVHVSKAWSVTRAAAREASADGMALPETIAADDEATLETGDAAYIPGNVEGGFRNDGDAPIVFLGFLIGPEGILGLASPTP